MVPGGTYREEREREENNFLLALFVGHQHCSLCIEGQLKQINLTTKEKLQINLILLNLTLKQIPAS